jgi:hypothetical protein
MSYPDFDGFCPDPDERFCLVDGDPPYWLGS